MQNSRSIVPVVFIHVGEIPDYLVLSIKQAAQYGNKVYLLTDNLQVKVLADVINVKTISLDEPDFKSYYKHMSSNSYLFEYMCIYRWYILKNFMQTHQIERVLYLDSDVYLYARTSEILDNYPDFDFAFNVPENQDNFYWAGSACCSLWTRNSIKLFCEKITSYYTTDTIEILNQKWQYHTDNKILGGICDMTFLYFFSKEKGFLNLGNVYNNHCFDFNNAISANVVNNEYRFKKGNLFQIPTKEIIFINGKPYGFHLISGKNICFFALTEYAKLLLFSKKHSLLMRLRHTIYLLKTRLLN